jgi:hypothetical protein
MATQRTARIKPEDVKMPEDHKLEVQDTTVEFNGEQFTIKGKALKDYRMLVMLKKVEKDASALPDVLTKLLGEEQHERMINTIEDEDGFVDLEIVADFLRKLMQEAGRKNS